MDSAADAFSANRLVPDALGSTRQVEAPRRGITKTRYFASGGVGKSSRSKVPRPGSDLELGRELLRHGDILEPHVAREPVFERREILSADERREIATRHAGD